MKQLYIYLFLSVLSINANAQRIDEQLMRLKLTMLPETVFRFPVGDSVGHGYYIATHFQQENSYGTHLGLDISGIGKGNSDLGDTIYSVGYGIVVEAYTWDYLSVYYKLNNKIIRTTYYHCDTVFCKTGDLIPKGFPIATIGNSKGTYLAHLHLEIIIDTILFVGFYGEPKGFIDPIKILPFHEKQ